MKTIGNFVKMLSKYPKKIQKTTVSLEIVWYNSTDSILSNCVKVQKILNKRKWGTKWV